MSFCTRGSFLLASFLTLATLAVGCATGSPTDVGPIPEVGSVDAPLLRRDGGDAAAPTCTTAAECDDRNACNGSETCTGGSCTPGVPVSCDDTVGCTTDTCDPLTAACSNVADDSRCSGSLVCDPVDGCTVPRACVTDDECDDDLLCNGVETCDAAFGCRRGTPPTCDDGLGCTADACDATTDACVNVPTDMLCGDGRTCNGAETCMPGAPTADANGCVAGTTLDCDDGVPCTMDTCDEGMSGCVHTPDAMACDDGVFCNGAEVCAPTTGCGPGMAPTCVDAIGCTTGRCDAATDRCVQAPDNAFCADGAVCNGDERCDVTGTTPGRGCVAGAPLDCSDGTACTTDSCTEPGTCVHGGSDADGDGYTAVGCATGNDCNDLSAAIHPGVPDVCDGIDNDCSGTADDGPGLTCVLGSAPRACTTTCGSPGTRACNAACGLGACIGTAELCNDCDDDGDGMIDDGFLCRRGTSSACTTVCGTGGSRTCTSDCSAFGVCAAAAETCNDCDDDADGLVDDGLACRRGTSMACTTTCGTSGSRVCALDCSGYGSCRAAAETCNGCDDDGDGSLDEDFACRMGQTQACTTACGTAGVRSCAGDCSGYGTCIATEVCNGCDDDADGTIDDGFSCAGGSSMSCTTTCGTSGTRSCNGTCSGFGACVATEACNGCDDDGDGSADEDFACRMGMSMGCTTSCATAGTRTCNATCSGFGSCSATEVCNGCDDDADGTPDDGFMCVGGSSMSCTTGCGTTGTRSCTATCSGFGSCAATEVCNGCDDDADGTPDDGFACVGGSTMACSTSCGSPGTRACNGTCSAYGTCSGAEICNGCDDNNSGAADETFTCVQGAVSSCTTACTTPGQRTCNGTCSGYSTCLAAAEVCGNGCDDNGNGMTDEGCAVAPPNDLCGGAIALTGTGTRSDTLVSATAQTSDCGNGVEVFYSVTVGSPSIVYFSTVGGATFNTRVSYRGASCAGSAVQCVDDSCGSVQSHLAQHLTPGTHYFAVHTFASTTTPAGFTLNWRIVATTAGTAYHLLDDDLPAPGGTQVQSGTTTSSGTLTPTSCGLASAGASGENTLYWAQCPADVRNYSATVCGAATWDTTLWFRLNGVQVGCNDDFCALQSQVSAPGVAGAGIVELLVDGYSLGSGPYTATVTF